MDFAQNAIQLNTFTCDVYACGFDTESIPGLIPMLVAV